MRLWLDDIRPMPDDFDLGVATADQAIYALDRGVITHISFDHDLGPEEAGTGYQVAKWIEQAAAERRLDRLTWAIHSANPVGRKNIQAAMEQAEKFWDHPGSEQGLIDGG